ncbi:A-kinase anchor protein 8-like isoform X6 [Hippoglossus hippoglossus]|uniref:A-kinase anchor protein 8-like isoform X6 n=1 Tax=Hippoglossus hippoglossus TaxID=8267 RepID=UPI00148B5971|nr:A-kinase anchor protein 8-like isoform X6 [Hippoglossus hippoglossus]
MDRGYGSGYSWGGGGGGSGSRAGSSGFDMYGGGYKDSMSGLGGYGGGGGGGGGSGQMKRSLSGASMLSSSGTHADAVIAKINQRLDMLTQLEGGLKGTRGDRFDQYESFDSRTSSLASSRDLYRSGGSSYGYDGGRGDNLLLGQRAGSGFGGGMGLGGGGGFDSPSSSYGVAKMRQNMRDSFTSSQGGVSEGGAWVWGGAGRRSPRRGGSAGGRGAGGGFGNLRSDSTPLGGGRGSGSGSGGQSHRGHSPGGGRGKLPSLLSNRMYPESGGFYQGSAQGPHDFPGRHFGGGPRAGRQRGRKRPLNKQQQQQQQQQVKPQRPDVQKKRKQMLTPADEPESKINKTESAGTEVTQEPAEKNGSASEPKTAAEVPVLQATKPAGDTDGDKASPKQEEKKKQQGKQSPVQGQDKHPKMRKRRGFLERVMFACSVCKFRSFYKEEMETHLDSRFHKDHFKFLSGQLSKPTTDFLQEYLQNKFTKTDQRISQVENHSAAICQVYKEQDLTRDLGMEHFMRKVEAAHCAACDLFIPMQQHLIQKHVKSADHNYNRKGMMEQSKRGSLSVARSILNHKLIGKKLESYLKGENPFTGNQDDQDPDDSMVMDVSELDLTSETADGQTADEQTADEQTADDQTADDQTADDQTADSKTADDQTADDQTADSKTADDQTADSKTADQTADGKAVDGQKADAQATDGQTAGGQMKEVAEGGAGQEAAKGEAVTEAAKEEKMEEDLGMGGEEEEQENQEEEDGFEVGEDDEGEEGYVVHDEIGEEGLPGELEDEDEGVEAAEVEEEENHK